MPLFATLDGRGPLRDQLVRTLRGSILEGRLEPGAKLPSTRHLAVELGVSRTTTQAAYEQLLAEGYLDARHGSGTFVAADLPRGGVAIVKREEVVPELSVFGDRLRTDFAYPYDDIGRLRPVRYEMLYGMPDVRGVPLQSLKRIIARRIDGARLRDLAYGDPAGTRALRKAIARHLGRARGVQCEPRQVIVVAGAQQALQLVTRLFVDPGDPVVVEEPCYLGARRVLLAEGAELCPVGVDEEGLDTDALGRVATARLVYVTPAHQFPTGAVLSAPRRLALLSWAARVNAHVIEDDYDGAFRFEGRPIEPLQRLDEEGRVIYVGSFSKALSPALRLGYAVVPQRLVAPLRSAKWLSDWSSPALLQDALADFIDEGHYARHVRRARSRLARKRKALLSAIARHLGDRAHVEGTGAGLHVLMWLHDVKARELDAFIAAAREEGVGIYSAAPYYASPPKRAGVLVGYALLGERQIVSAIRCLRRALDRWS